MKLESFVKILEDREIFEFIFFSDLICFVKSIFKIKICQLKTVEIEFSLITLGIAVLLFC